MPEQPLLLRRRLADHHRPLELREVAPDGRARPGDEDVALAERDAARERVWDRGVAADLTPVARVRPLENVLGPVDLADRVEHREGRLVARALRDLRLVTPGRV